MTIDEVTAIASSALYLVVKVAAPVLLVSLVVGLLISIFQTVTSIQEL
ncbi:MAG: flagellar biosynthetic protein FliQ [Lachnospiraceae bacterium]|nr:flagellar biosynthetic protein FliQ [Lachnospiraceae bacterium]